MKVTFSEDVESYDGFHAAGSEAEMNSSVAKALVDQGRATSDEYTKGDNAKRLETMRNVPGRVIERQEVSVGQLATEGSTGTAVPRDSTAREPKETDEDTEEETTSTDETNRTSRDLNAETDVAKEQDTTPAETDSAPQANRSVPPTRPAQRSAR